MLNFLDFTEFYFQEKLIVLSAYFDFFFFFFQIQWVTFWISFLFGEVLSSECFKMLYEIIYIPSIK